MRGPSDEAAALVPARLVEGVLRGAGRDLAYIVVHGDAALDVIGGISSK